MASTAVQWPQVPYIEARTEKCINVPTLNVHVNRLVCLHDRCAATDHDTPLRGRRCVLVQTGADVTLTLAVLMLTHEETGGHGHLPVHPPGCFTAVIRILCHFTQLKHPHKMQEQQKKSYTELDRFVPGTGML